MHPWDELMLALRRLTRAVLDLLEERWRRWPTCEQEKGKDINGYAIVVPVVVVLIVVTKLFG